MTWSIKEKTVIVTGGNSGIGRATVSALAEAGANVVFTSRDLEKGRQVAKAIGYGAQARKLDLASFGSIDTFSQELLREHPQIDVLINNAGLFLTDREMTADGLEYTLGVNHFGHFRLTQHLLPALKNAAKAGEGARIINVASRAHRQSRGIPFDDLQAERGYNGWKRYADSKLANILFTIALQERLQGSDVHAFSLHPGVVRTGFGQDGDVHGIWNLLIKIGRPFFITPERGAETSIHLATQEGVEQHAARYFDKCRPGSTSRYAQDTAAAERLWQVSEEIAGIR